MKALLIYNPWSGRRNRSEEMAQVVSRLSSGGWQVELGIAADGDEVERLACGAVAGGTEVVVAAGGDGTVNAALQALANKTAVLGVLPMGTANAWAREMGIPSDLVAAADVLLAGEVARVDLGLANGRYFLNVASIGFDASVTRHLDPRAKRRLGMLAYVVAAVAEGLQLRGEEVAITADGSTSRERMLMLVANNIRSYGGVLTMAPEAYADDGLLDVLVFKGHGLFAALRHVALVLLGRHTRDPETAVFRSSTLSVYARASLPVELDGDYFGTTPVTIRVVPGALRVLIPPGPHAQLKGLRTED